MVSRMDKNQIIAVLFAFLMVTSMIAWGALHIF
ncbi:surface glycoprotein [Natronococcus pandeyae]|nr:surface glycoprotein [Natronococcus pandeyae]